MRWADLAARVMQAERIAPEHVLIALAEADFPCVACEVLKDLGVPLKEVSRPLGLDRLAYLTKINVDHFFWREEVDELPCSDAGARLISDAREESRKMGHNYLGTEHLLLALLRREETTAAKVLLQLGVDIDVLRKRTVQMLSPPTG